jgi:PAS domain S-box-containing protein
MTESDAALRLALEAGQMGTWTADAKFRRAVVSPELERLHGVGPGELRLGLDDYLTHVHPDDRARLRETLERSYRLSDGHEVEYRVVWPDGTVRWLLGKGRGERDSSGALRRIAGICMDVTDRKLAEEELRRRDERYRAFINNSTEGIWRVELETPASTALSPEEQIAHFYRYAVLAECNDAMARMYGFDRSEELVGARLGDLLVEDDPVNREYLTEFISSGYRLSGHESHERDRHGAEKWFRNSLIGVVEDGLIIRAWGTQTDITQQKRVEDALREASRTKDEFLATVSHELRTPLNAVLGWTMMLKGESEPARLARGLEAIDRNARMLARIVEDLLDFSRVNRGELRIDRVPTDLLDVVRNAVQSVEFQARQKGVEVHVDVADPAREVLGDADRLQQMVCNLLSNGIKFSERGATVVVCVRGSDDEVRLTVCDTGVGIRRDHLSSIFDPFRQGDAHGIGGLGLGLAIVRHVAEAHGGTVAAESEGEGKGATFTVRLPMT